MTLADWSEARVWKEGEPCVGDMPRSFTGSLENPRISEAGRLFLAERLMLLSNKQIRDLFRAAHVERRNETMADGRRRKPAGHGRGLGARVRAQARRDCQGALPGLTIAPAPAVAYGTRFKRLREYTSNPFAGSASSKTSSNSSRPRSV